MVFVCSTTGQGEEPYNMKVNKLNDDISKGLHWGCRNSGDSCYVKTCHMISFPISIVLYLVWVIHLMQSKDKEKRGCMHVLIGVSRFNYPAKKLYKRLQQLGANLMIQRGDGDDQHYLG